MRAILIAALLAVPAPLALAAPQPDPSPTVYWKIRGCDHSHREKVARNRITTIMHTPGPLRLRKAWHYAVCVKYRASHLRLARYLRRQRAWRETADWSKIEFEARPAYDQQWAWSTGACESGNNPATNTGNGYYGAFQFTASTWHAAGGPGLPHYFGWYFQANIAIDWMHVAGAGQWPVCG